MADNAAGTVTLAPSSPPPATGAAIGTYDIGLYAIAIMAWSTSWIALKYQVVSGVPAEVSIALRFAAASAIMFAWVLASRRRVVFPLRLHLRMALTGALLFSLNFYCFYLGGRFLASGLLSVVFSLASIGNLLLGALLLGQRINARIAFGAIVGLVGIALIFAPEITGTTLNHDALTGLGLCVAGTICFCFGNVISSRLQSERLPVFSTNAWGMAYGALVMAVIALLSGDSFAVPLTTDYVVSFAWLTVVSTVVAFACYLTLLGRIGSARAGYATVVFPVFALLISTVVEGYQWSVPAIAGLVMVLTGNVIVLTRRRG
ncbi:putative amino-acid metabolite efflux pump [Hartmannibacter diazotrophicus]|uniref:Putative amino-acid metabolite efflux pump n=1 Tax=Hartmannibacter diazotrophicus TaxID=1482074 RepID=A0A2C9D2R9_9HYPH|nr:DMT family transporter [Hartmannibacter diazotrophicus]SON54523.1 putative amino-acid metabolite efflux pump [Hartmannibacter diazotrophicus]